LAWCRGGDGLGGEDGAVELPVAAVPLLDRTRIGRWGVAVAAVNLVLCALAPTSYLWHCATGAHQPSMGWAPPIRAQVKGPVSRWADWWRSIPTVIAVERVCVGRLCADETRHTINKPKNTAHSESLVERIYVPQIASRHNHPIGHLPIELLQYLNGLSFLPSSRRELNELAR
jgi:hypothetical protein